MLLLHLLSLSPQPMWLTKLRKNKQTTTTTTKPSCSLPCNMSSVATFLLFLASNTKSDKEKAILDLVLSVGTQLGSKTVRRQKGWT